MKVKNYDGVVEDLDSFINFLDALAVIISEMFGRNCEVVISDLDNPSHSVISIYNGKVTNRKVGDPLNTRTEELIEKSIGGVSINYRKSNRKNKKEIKSSTIVTKAFGRNLSFCINYDCDDLSILSNSLKQFLSIGEEIYKEYDVENDSMIEPKLVAELEKLDKPFSYLNKKERVEFIRRLKEAGVFKIQKSVPYVSNKLGLSRYTIYNYLNEIEGNN